VPASPLYLLPFSPMLASLFPLFFEDRCQHLPCILLSSSILTLASIFLLFFEDRCQPLFSPLLVFLRSLWIDASLSPPPFSPLLHCSLCPPRIDANLSLTCFPLTLHCTPALASQLPESPEYICHPLSCSILPSHPCFTAPFVLREEDRCLYACFSSHLSGLSQTSFFIILPLPSEDICLPLPCPLTHASLLPLSFDFRGQIPASLLLIPSSFSPFCPTRTDASLSPLPPRLSSSYFSAASPPPAAPFGQNTSSEHRFHFFPNPIPTPPLFPAPIAGECRNNFPSDLMPSQHSSLIYRNSGDDE
jgi:hypothetical protein